MNDSNEILLNIIGCICWIAAIIIIAFSFKKPEAPVIAAVEEVEYVMPNGKPVVCFVAIDPENKSERRVPLSCEYKQ